VLLIIGVTSSIVSSIRKVSAAQQRPGLGPVTAPPRQATVKELVAALQAQAQAQAQAPPAQSRAAPPARPAPQPAKAPATVRRSAAPPDQLPWPVAPVPRSSAHRLFAGRGDAVRGIIAAEILGSPRGLRDEPFWR